MKPVLFPSDATTFNSNGVGVLDEATECRVTRNIETGEYELSMMYPITGKWLSELTGDMIIAARPAPGMSAEPFDIYSITKSFDGFVEVLARHVSYRLAGVPVKPFTATTASGVMDAIKANEALPSASPFTFTSSVAVSHAYEITTPQSARDCLSNEETGLTAVFGGELDFKRFAVEHVSRLGEDRGLQIRYGKNMIDLNDETESGLPNGIYPYWYKEDVALVYPASTDAASDRYGLYEIVDMTQDYDEPPTAATLKAAAEARASALVAQNASIKVSFADLSQQPEYKDLAALEAAYIGDTVYILYRELGVKTTARIIETVFDVLADRYDSVTAGTSQPSLAATIAGDAASQTSALAEALHGIVATKSIDLTTSYAINAGQAKGATPTTNVDIYGGYYPLEVIRMRASNNNISFAEARLNRGTTTTVTFGARNNAASNLSGVTIRAIILYIKKEYAVLL